MDDEAQSAPMEIGGDPVDGLEWQPFPQQGGGGGRNGRGDAQPPCAPARQAQGQGGRGGRGGAATIATYATVGSQILGQVAGTGPEVCSSFDGKWDAFIENYNVFLRPAGAQAPQEPAGRGRGNNATPPAIPLLGSEHYRDDYFVHYLLGVKPPDWNRVSLPELPPDTGGGN